MAGRVEVKSVFSAGHPLARGRRSLVHHLSRASPVDAGALLK